ncbi:MAG: hypothetical protein ACRENP_08055 [Longimicrobiales bacterium]
MQTRLSAAAVASGGDTICVTHTLYNDATSALRVETLAIPTPVKPIIMITPGMRKGWVRSAGIIADSVALEWFAATDSASVSAGDSAAPFAYSGVGVLGIVRYYVRGYVPPPPFDDSVPDLYKARLPIWEDSYRNWTIALRPFPTNMTPLGLVQRLESLTDEACSLGWVAEPGICNSLEAKQRAARRAIERGDLPAACNNINALLNEVNGLPDSKIRPEGRSLLRLNAQHLVRMHCGG